MSDGAWGTPRYLRDVLREAARCGRRRAGHVDLLLGRRSVAQPRPPGRQRRAGRRRSRQPALGARDRRVRRRRAAGIASTRTTTARHRRRDGKRQRRDLQPPGPGGRAGGAGRAAAAGASTSRPTIPARPPPLAAAAAARVLADEPRPLRGGAARAAGADRRRPRRRRRRARAGGRRASTHAIGSGTASRSGTAWSTRAPRAWRPPIPSASRCWRRARCPREEINRPLWRWREPGNSGCGGRRGDQTRSPARTCAWPGASSRLFLTSLPVQEALCWLARHVRALSEGARWTFWQGQDHGALIERIRHACETVREALGPDDGATKAGVAAPGDGARRSPVPGAAVGTFLATAFRPGGMTQHGGQGEPRATALTSDAVGDHHRRRGPRRAHRGGELERAPFAPASVSRPVHRSPR